MDLARASATGLLLLQKPPFDAVLILAIRAQGRRGKVRPVRRVWPSLRLERDGGILRQRRCEVLRGIKLNARLGCPYLERAARFRLAQGCGVVQFAALAVQAKIDVIDAG